MASSIFVNLPVSNLDTAIAYYQALGFSQNSQFSDDTGACMVISDAIYVMVLTHAKFRQFSDLPIPDAREQRQALYALSCDSREAVDQIAERGLAAGGRETRERQDMGFMYSRAIADPDGHTWEHFWMDMSQMPTE